MSGLARPLAVLAGVAGVVLALAALVREVALAADDTLVWTPPAWWRDLTDNASTATTVAAVVASVLTILCLILAVRQFTGGDSESRIGAGEGAAVSVEALERLVARRLDDAVPGIAPVGVRLHRVDEGWEAEVLADLVPDDVARLQAAAAELADAELRQAAGQGLVALELEARRFVEAVR